MSEDIIEEWRDIKGYEGLYKVSNLGRVKSMNFHRSEKEIILKAHIHKSKLKEYYRINLCKDGNTKLFLVHQLVAQAFIKDYFIGCGKVVNHIDGNSKNNKSNNLEPRTTRENCSSICFRKNQNKLTSQYDNVCFDKLTGKWHSQIYYNGKYYNLGYFDMEIESSKQSKIALSHINNGTFEEYYEKLRDSKYIKVLQYSKSGEFIREWNSATEAAKELNIIGRGNIPTCCRGKQKTVYGFIWKYKDM